MTVNFQLSRTDPAGSLLPVTTQSVNGTSRTTFTTLISSFGRDHSGNYTCTASVSSTLNSLYLISSRESYGTAWITVGVYLALRNQFIESNSNILITNIGTTSDSPSGALQCVTDRNPCCRNVDPRLGEWYFPSGALVQQGTSPTRFYRNRGDDGTVNLNHPAAVSFPTGQFCCVVPDAININQTVCINIGELYALSISVSVTIKSSGTSIAGEMYALECSVGGIHESITFQWLGPPDGSTPVVGSRTRIIARNSSVIHLQFNPLKQTDNGTYVCRTEILGTTHSKSVHVTASAPDIYVQLNVSGATSFPGETSMFTCRVSGAENLDPIITYQWTKGNGSHQMQVGTNSSTLSFSPLRLSDTGQYLCLVTVSSSYIGYNIILTTDTQEVKFQGPSDSPQDFITVPQDRNIQLSWSPPATANHDIITSYTLICVSAVVAGVNTVTVTYAEAGNYSLGGFRPSTEYNCSLFASNIAGDGPPASIRVMTMNETSVFQFLLAGLDSCLEWISDNTDSKLGDIAAAVLNNIQGRCQCSFVGDRITDEVFHCIPASPQAVVYRAVLHGTASANSAELVTQIEQWISERASITVGQMQLSVDEICSVLDFSAEGCRMRETTTSLSYQTTTSTVTSGSPTSKTVSAEPSGESIPTDYTVAFISGGTVVAVVVVVSTAVVLISITALILKNRQTHHKSDLKHHQTRTQQYWEEESQYEYIHRCSPEYEEVQQSKLQNQVPNDQQCDFDLWQCPAYGPLPLYQSILDKVVEAEVESEQL